MAHPKVMQAAAADVVKQLSETAPKDVACFVVVFERKSGGAVGFAGNAPAELAKETLRQVLDKGFKRDADGLLISLH